MKENLHRTRQFVRCADELRKVLTQYVDCQVEPNVEDDMSKLDQSDVRTLEGLVVFINYHAAEELPPGNLGSSRIYALLDSANAF